MPEFIKRVLKINQACVLCADKSPHYPLCADCEADLPYLLNGCECCALPLPPGNALCGSCQSKTTPYSKVYAPFHYAFPMDQFVTGLKFRHKLHYAPLMAMYLARHLEMQMEQKPELLVPVPLHASRIKERGFNQSQELARLISRHLQIPVAPNLVKRMRATARQSELKRKEKLKNLRNAFRLEQPLDAGHIMLIDDVMTSGTTVTEISNLLRRQGATRIDIAVVTRAG